MHIDIEQMQSAAGQAEALLKALGNRQRLMILCQLVDGEKSVGEIAKILDLGQSALSQHLARLRADGLVATRREAQTIFYSLAAEEPGRVIRLLYDMYCAPACGPRAKPTSLKDAINKE